MSAQSTPYPIKLIVTGSKIETPLQDNPELSNLFEIKEDIDLQKSARGSVREEELTLTDEIIRYTANDGTTWYGYADDIVDVLEAPSESAEHLNRGSNDNAKFTFRVPTVITAMQSRGGLVQLVSKGLRIFKIAAKSPAEKLAQTLAAKIDDRACTLPGLHHVLPTGTINPEPVEFRSNARGLIFIHGTISNFSGAFGGFGAGDWAAFHKRYDGNVFAFNHHTLTESPVGNALRLLQDLPKGAQIDIVSHSRGGLVADALARCDAGIDTSDRGYTNAEHDVIRRDYTDNNDIDRVTRETNKEKLIQEMIDLTALANTREITIKRIVRVAAPSAGTKFLDRRLDHFVTALYNLIKLSASAVPVLGGLVNLLEALTIAVLHERTDPAVLPGLYAQTPGSGYERIHNSSRIKLQGTLVSIAGDTDVGGGILNTLGVLMSNVYYRDANDFVVDTDSMTLGAPQRDRHYSVLIKSSAVNHFTYFSAPHHREAVRSLLLEQLPLVAPLKSGLIVRDLNALSQGYRGAMVDKIYSPGEVFQKNITNTDQRPVTIILPGIMGSNLYLGSSDKKNRKWVDVSALMNGALVDDLYYSKNKSRVEAHSLIGNFYGDLIEYLSEAGQDVVLFPYDWRLPLATSAAQLNTLLAKYASAKQPISLLAHSMGGLVARQFMLDYTVEWTNLRTSPTANARLIMLGTPWRGSHLVTEVLTGHSGRIKQLYRLDLRHSKKKILKTVFDFEGLTNLLPLDDANLRDESHWNRLLAASGRGLPVLPQGFIDKFTAYVADIEDRLNTNPRLGQADYDAMIYVAGYHPDTVDGYFMQHKRFSQREELQYTTSPEGDGNVTWEKGIPKQLDADNNLYFVNAQHGNLAADRRLFAGLLELLRSGVTSNSAFAKTRPATIPVGTRGIASKMAPQRREASKTVPAQSALAALFGIEPEGVGLKIPTVHVKVFNADLKWATYPVVVGHFKQMGIVSAERAVDKYLGDVLSERYRLGFYPGEIGEQEVIVDPTSRPQGAIVVGLGHKDDLTGSQLARTVQLGLVKYAMFRRDNHLDMSTEREGESGLGVSMLLVGTNFGELPLRECLRNLLAGVIAANQNILQLERKAGRSVLQPIRHVEIVDYYEDRAYEAFQTLQNIVARENIRGIVLNDSLEVGFGRRKRFLRAAERGWWQTITTKTEDIPAPLNWEKEQRERLIRGEQVEDVDWGKRLRFSTYSRGSSVSSEDVYSNLALAQLLARDMSRDENGNAKPLNAEASKVLFELLIPNAYKDFIRNFRNITWQMDAESAAFPWELFYDEATGPVPTFVRAGMVRQLYTNSARLRPAFVGERTALVVADAHLDEERKKKFGQLDGALTEGRQVARLLQENNYQDDYGTSTVTLLERRSASEIVKALFLRPYKVVHIAAHGIVGRGTHDTGVVLSDGVYLTPGMFNQLSTIPEFVFINCCHLGSIDAKHERDMQSRYKLAANIGSELIGLGVRAVVVAGWGISDAPAALWSNTFYGNLLKGVYFGEAVRVARKLCFEAYPDDNTWGAYQCYGDQFYRIADESDSIDNEVDGFDLEQELFLELDNLISKARATPYAEREWLMGGCNRATRIVARAKELAAAKGQNKLSTGLLERKATFELYTGNYSAAVKTYAELFSDDSGVYKLRSYFTYINIRVRLATTKGLSGEVSDDGAFGDALTLIARMDEIVKIAKENYDDSASSSEKRGFKLGMKLLSDRASMHKRLAVLAPTDDSAKMLLKSAAKNYLKAAKMIGIERPQSIYHYCSYIQLTSLSAFDKEEALVDITNALDGSPATYFEDWVDNLMLLSRDRDSPYASLRLSNLLLTKTVWNIIRSPYGEIDLKLSEVADRLIESHRSQQQQGFNLRDLRGQIEHYDILLCLGERLKVLQPDHRAELLRVRMWLQSRITVPSGNWGKDLLPPDCIAADQAVTTATDLAPSPMDSVAATPPIPEPESDESLLIDTQEFVVPTSKSRGKKAPVTILVPAESVAALIEIEDEQGDTHFAWTMTTSASRGTNPFGMVRGTTWEVPLRLSDTRGPKIKLGKFFRKVLKGVVKFFKSTKDLVGKELLNKYTYQEVILAENGKVSFNPISKDEAFMAATSDEARSLLMLHGMFNTAEGTFKDLLKQEGAANKEFAKVLIERYSGKALVMNMPTIFRNFEHNVDALPISNIQSTTLDIIANSRGTNVARQLALKLDKTPGTKRGQIFLAGGPAYGTPFADSEQMLSLVNSATSMLQLAGKPLGPLFSTSIWLLEKGARKLLSGDGLIDMAPDSPTLAKLNAQWDFSNRSTCYVGSDYTPDKRLKRLIDAQLIDRKLMGDSQNDGIIPTKSTLGLRAEQQYRPSDTKRFKVSETKACGHFMYYQQEEVVKRLVRHLREG